jgi:ceramide glucosyltransferase
VIYALALVCIAALAYQLTALVAVLVHMVRSDPSPARFPPVSILKPVRGLDEGFREAIRSHAAQDYPEFEILFGAGIEDDAAVAEIQRLQAEFPSVPIRLVRTTRKAPNGKVATLVELAAQARHPVLLVNDSDILVPVHYLRRVVAPLEDAGVGLVTCLYRASASTFAGQWEAVGIATDFAPSTLVAPLAGVKEFALGSTLVFRAGDLRCAGGFEAIEEYLADDYQLAKRITGLGLRVHLSKVVVETGLQAGGWGDVWNHQLRWHRTIRVSRGGYAGLFVTNASLWAVVAAAAGLWWACWALMAARMTMGLAAGVGLLRCPVTARYGWLIPLRDLWGSAVWIVGLTGSTVVWRGQVMWLRRDGRIEGRG